MTTEPASGLLTPSDILDLRAYERVRAQTRTSVLELRRRRRVNLGPIMTVAFENRETVRYQIQEMLRIEKTITDEGVQDELSAYNPLIPGSGRLTATVFLELTDPDQMHLWLTRLAGVENHLLLELDGGQVRGRPDPGHAGGLTRSETTAAVHYLSFHFDEAQIAALGTFPVTLACDHPHYRHQVVLDPAVAGEIAADAR